MGGLQIFGLICMAGGLGCMFSALRAMARRRAVRRNPIRKKARVLRLELTPSSGDDGPAWYIPWVQFRGQDGHTYEGPLPEIRDTQRYRVNRTVPVLYERGNPPNFIDASSEWTETAAHVIGLTLSVLFFGMGAALVFAMAEP